MYCVMPQICGGCSGYFASEGGYQHHHTMTKNNACQKFHDQQLQEVSMDIDNQDQTHPQAR